MDIRTMKVGNDVECNVRRETKWRLWGGGQSYWNSIGRRTITIGWRTRGKKDKDEKSYKERRAMMKMSRRTNRMIVGQS